MTFAIIGVLTILAGSVLLYLASPNQCAIRKALPFRPAVWFGALLLLAGQAMLLTWAGPATAVFIGVTVAMTVWCLVPLLAAWRRSRSEVEA